MLERISYKSIPVHAGVGRADGELAAATATQVVAGAMKEGNRVKASTLV